MTWWFMYGLVKNIYGYFIRNSDFLALGLHLGEILRNFFEKIGIF